jgi:D-methionine transport system ATP-binding protein
MTTILKGLHLVKEIGDNKVLNDISLEISKGEIFGIIGKSGAGKSTLLKCLSSLEYITCGAIELFGEPLFLEDKKSLKGFRKKLGMIFQNFQLLSSRTVEENISLPLELEKVNKKEIQKRVEELLSLVGLTKRKAAYPSSLSGGEKQRVAIARALASRPDILFCDEATSSLDPKTTKEILELLCTLNKELSLTIVLVTHEMEVIRRICTHIAVIDAGKIVEQGPSLQVLSTPQHEITKSLLQNSTHELNLSVLQEKFPDQLFLTLHFEGESSETPLLSKLISEVDVEVNILSGWIDAVNNTSLGSLTVAIKGSYEEALAFLQVNKVSYEVLS